MATTLIWKDRLMVDGALNNYDKQQQKVCTITIPLPTAAWHPPEMHTHITLNNSQPKYDLH